MDSSRGDGDCAAIGMRELNVPKSVLVEPAWLREGTGLYQQTSIVDFDGSKLEGLLKFIGRGLAWHHWELISGPMTRKRDVHQGHGERLFSEPDR